MKVMGVVRGLSPLTGREHEGEERFPRQHELTGAVWLSETSLIAPYST